MRLGRGKGAHGALMQEVAMDEQGQLIPGVEDVQALGSTLSMDSVPREPDLPEGLPGLDLGGVSFPQSDLMIF